MLKKTNNEINKTVTYNFIKNPIEFSIAEDTVPYKNDEKKSFNIYYDKPEHSIRLLKGNCIEILNCARENSVDMIFADPPYFLSNGGFTCHAGKMVSVNKGKWEYAGNQRNNYGDNMTVSLGNFTNTYNTNLANEPFVKITKNVTVTSNSFLIFNHAGTDRQC